MKFNVEKNHISLVLTVMGSKKTLAVYGAMKQHGDWLALVEIAEIFGVEVRKVFYHVSRLHQANLIIRQGRPYSYRYKANPYCAKIVEEILTLAAQVEDGIPKTNGIMN